MFHDDDGAGWRLALLHLVLGQNGNGNGKGW